MAWTQTDLDRVEAAIANGTLRVRTSDGRLLEYREMDELKMARDMIKEELAKNTTPKRSRVRRISTHSGY